MFDPQPILHLISATPAGFGPFLQQAMTILGTDLLTLAKWFLANPTALTAFIADASTGNIDKALLDLEVAWKASQQPPTELQSNR